MGRLHEYFNFHSIRTHMVLSFMLLISMIVLFVSLVSYQYTVRDFENVSIQYTVRLLNECAKHEKHCPGGRGQPGCQRIDGILCYNP